MPPRPSLTWKLVILSSLYFVQGLPAGFQATALPTYLYQAGVGKAALGYLGALALPWSLKVLWAPLVDAYWSPALGKRRSWILPMQALLLLTCVAAALTPVPGSMTAFLGLVMLMNLFAATMDIAVDGLAVDLLTPEELGHGNSSQVVGYKCGMLAGGGLLMWAASSLGWRVLLLAMAGLVLLVLLFTLTWREPEAEAAPDRGPEPEAPAAGGPGKLRQAVGLLLRTVKVPGAGWVLLYVATYKAGETLVDVMFKPFLIDAGYINKVGLWMGTYGMVASLLGSLAGGFLASRWSIWAALMVATALRAGPVVGEWWLAAAQAAGHLTEGPVLAVTIAEHFFGGALTTVVFAFMMARVDPRIGGSHFTLLATVEVIGKLAIAPASGHLAERMGYPGLFALGSGLSLAVLLVVLPLRQAPPARAPQQV